VKFIRVLITIEVPFDALENNATWKQDFEVIAQELQADAKEIDERAEATLHVKEVHKYL
jgi:hypothetical protein